ncbi:cytochrome c oxidase assembly protein [Mycobacteroides abscessus]|uniref:cytochrome c oxidase assembly protein n=1 Tax=Mycobacteroides abscessus TaxID=36809 RepID=UPI0005167FAD|nr:cytochrome c oxidase assembly protein [Mycobacteroides abscessus]
MTPPPAPPSITSMLTWDPPAIPVLPTIAVLMALWYMCAAARVHKSGRRWPWPRTVSFITGCLVLAAVNGLAIEGYGLRLFSAFMFQQLTLTVLVPPLLVLGSPGRLLLRSTAHRGLGRLVLIAALAGLRSRTARILLNPGLTIPLFLFSYYGLYLSDLFDHLAATWLGHTALEVFFLATGILFIVPILSTDPLPVRQSNLGRLFDVFVEMPLHVFIGVILMMAPTPLVATFADPPSTWNVNPVKDQSIAGALAWSYGEPIALVTTVLLAMRWRRDEEREATVREAFTDDHDPDLAAYNAFLQHLHGRPPQAPPVSSRWARWR